MPTLEAAAQAPETVRVLHIDALIDRLVPNDLPPWEIVYQQTQRWLGAAVFEAMVHDLRLLLRTSASEQDRAQVEHLA